MEPSQLWDSSFFYKVISQNSKIEHFSSKTPQKLKDQAYEDVLYLRRLNSIVLAYTCTKQTKIRYYFNPQGLFR